MLNLKLSYLSFLVIDLTLDAMNFLVEIGVLIVDAMDMEHLLALTSTKVSELIGSPFLRVLDELLAGMVELFCPGPSFFFALGLCHEPIFFSILIFDSEDSSLAEVAVGEGVDRGVLAFASLA